PKPVSQRIEKKKVKMTKNQIEKTLKIIETTINQIENILQSIGYNHASSNHENSMNTLQERHLREIL
ncbi:MAG: hypothetical protein DRP08_07495, partial [Candidatus Aenigmatarchaeota archaeon]